MTDTTIILDFLKKLRENNNKEWMDQNRSWYQEAKGQFENLISRLLLQMTAFDESLRNVLPKTCIFRINRDIRFSNDKSPYKTNFGAFMAEEGRHTTLSGYYIHLQPDGESFLAGGLYMPAGEQLKKIRQEIDYNPSELKKIVDSPEFTGYFQTIQGEKLKKAPKGYPADHPNLEFLKLKSYLMMHKITDQQVTATDFSDYAVKVFAAMKPMNDYLNVAVS
jgi:uncharacterized protein (TIGR02453 family)